MMKRIASVLPFVFGVVGLLGGCGSSSDKAGFTDDGGTGADATTQNGGDGGPTFVPAGDAGGQNIHDCTATSQDTEGCSCAPADATRACYTGDPKTRNVGNCKDGVQKCLKQGEFSSWSVCTGSSLPGYESCIGNVDTNCNGKVGCTDPQCATNPACQTGCTDGQTRPCYTGPAGTENVGTCKDGVQTCKANTWGACVGEVDPTTENCCDALDHNCNGWPGCLDIFTPACITAACCQSQCTSPLANGCVCPKGSGDTQTCPDGDHVVHTGGFPGTDQCCPCTDCNDINCCGNAVCNGSATCAGLNCNKLPPSCNGQVNTDCDDFPEDCDEPCCKCSNCP
jgi:hypothetical protein